MAAQGKTSAQSQQALETLSRIYWYPLYAFLRRQGRGPEDAEDLTQEFFLRLLEKNYLKSVDRDKGRFRTFLLVALKRFLANEWDRIGAQKRGGGKIFLSLDTTEAETRYELEASRDLSAEKIFDRRWAMTLLEQTMTRLREEFEASGKSAEFDALKIFLTAEKGSFSYGPIASELGINEGALRVAIHRLRRRFRELFKEEIAQTVAAPQEIDEEVRYLMSVLAE